MFAESSVHAAAGSGARGWRLAAGAVVVAMLVALALWGMSSGGGPTAPGGQGTAGTAMRTFTDQSGWAWRYPASWHLERSEEFEGLSMVEVTVANFASLPGIEQHVYRGGGNVRAVPPVATNDSFPADGVALRLVSETGGLWVPIGKDTRLPIVIRAFLPVPLVSGLRYDADTGATFGGYRGLPRSLVRQLVLADQQWTAVLWIGPHASRSSVAIVSRIITSLSATHSGSATSTLTAGSL